MSESYIGQIIGRVNAVTEACGPILLYGENIDTGSRIAGLARGLKVNPAGRILNVGNCELTHIGVGLGMMLDGGKATVFMKQLDFLLLGLDQMVNTFNVIRSCHDVETLGSFTIFVIVCDQGYQGPQSSINAAGDFASLVNISAFCLNGADDASAVVGNHFVRPGFRMICLSQRLFGAPALTLAIESCSADHAVFQYRSGTDVTIVSFNFALRDSIAVADALGGAGLQTDLFHVNYVPGMDISMIEKSCARTKKLVLIDDSKSITKFGDALVTVLKAREVKISVLPLSRRGCAPEGYGVAEDRFLPDHETVLRFARSA